MGGATLTSHALSFSKNVAFRCGGLAVAQHFAALVLRASRCARRLAKWLYSDSQGTSEYIYFQDIPSSGSPRRMVLRGPMQKFR